MASDFDDMWYSIPGVEFLETDEVEYERDKLESLLDQFEASEHMTLQSFGDFWEFLDDFGMDVEDFPWDAFQEWYDARG